MKNYLKTFFIVSFIVFIILFSFLLHIFNQNFYSQKFAENGAYDLFGKDKINKVNSEVFGYFMFRNNLETDFFNEKETKHLEDVRTIFVVGYILLLISFISLTLLLYFNKQDSYELFLFSSIVGLMFILILVFLSFFDFSFLFNLFHELFFKEGTWSFDTNIVMVYTFDLFYDLFLRVLITSILTFIAVIIFFLIKNRLKY